MLSGGFCRAHNDTAIVADCQRQTGDHTIPGEGTNFPKEMPKGYEFWSLSALQHVGTCIPIFYAFKSSAVEHFYAVVWC